VKAKEVQDLIRQPQEKPLALAQAELLHQKQATFIEENKKNDASLGHGIKPIDLDQVRHTYYEVLQNNYDKKDLEKLKKVSGAVFPPTKKILSERKARNLVAT